MFPYSQYFKARNGTFKRVPQFANLGLGVQAGVTVYYIRGYQASAKVTAFKPVGSRTVTSVTSIETREAKSDDRASACLLVTA